MSQEAKVTTNQNGLEKSGSFLEIPDESENQQNCSYLSRLFQPVSIESLFFFRIYFGIMMIADLVSYFLNNWITSLYIKPDFLFKYYYFEWVHPWPGIGMYLHFVVMIILAVCITIGLFYRICAILFCLGITYLFLLEQAIYLNHMYLICLLSFLIAILPLHRACSLDSIRHPQIRTDTVPAWMLWLLRFQISIPYFFGGIAKLNHDWLSGETVRLFFLTDAFKGGAKKFLIEDFSVYGITYLGTMFDLLIVPLLLWKRTRLFAFSCAILFHISNMFLFNIGIFPWMMIGATLIFFSPDWPSRLFKFPSVARIQSKKPVVQESNRFMMPKRLVIGLLCAYCLFHLLLPFRHLLYPGNPSWTEEGHRFAWRMMLRKKITDVQIQLVDHQTKKSVEFNVYRELTPTQAKKMARSPDMLLQFAHYLKQKYDASEKGRFGVHAIALVSLNGRKPQLLIDPKVDLSQKSRTMRHQDWIMPLNQNASRKWIMKRYQSHLTSQ